MKSDGHGSGDMLTVGAILEQREQPPLSHISWIAVTSSRFRPGARGVLPVLCDSFLTRPLTAVSGLPPFPPPPVCRLGPLN